MSLLGDAWRAIKRKPARWFIKAVQDVAALIKQGRKKK